MTQDSDKLGVLAPLPTHYSDLDDSDYDSDFGTNHARRQKEKRRRKKRALKSKNKKYVRITWRDRIAMAVDPRRDEVTFGRAIVATLAEFICTWLFVFFATAAVVAAVYVNENANLIIAFGQGLALALAVFIAASISGGHLNPAVTISMFFVGRISLWRGLMYIVAQFAGAIAASAILKAIVRGPYEGSLGATAVNPDISTAGAFFLEVIMTFLLVFVLFATALDPSSKVGPMAPLAVGLCVLVDDLIGVQWTGSSMNPARTLGPQLVSGDWDHYWLYFFAPLTGALFAAILYEGYMHIRPYEPPARTKLVDASDHDTSKDKEKMGKATAEARVEQSMEPAIMHPA